MGRKGFHLKKKSSNYVNTGLNLSCSQRCKAGNYSFQHTPPTPQWERQYYPIFMSFFEQEEYSFFLLPLPASKKDGMDSFCICYALICFNRTRVQATSPLLWLTYQLDIFSYIFNLIFNLIKLSFKNASSVSSRQFSIDSTCWKPH